LGHEAFGGLMEVQRTAFEASSAARESVSRNGLCDGISTSAASLSKTEVVVGGDVETTSATAGGIEISVVILGVAIVTDDRAAGNSGNRGGEAIIDAEFESSGIE
jgi:hypothetical protein